MVNYEDKWIYLTRHYSGLCPIALEIGKKRMVCHDLHHRCHNRAWARKKFPLFIDSILNLATVNHTWHLMHPSWGKITDYRAEKIERFLERNPRISDFVNNPQEY